MNKILSNRLVWVAPALCLVLSGCDFHRGTDDLEQLVSRELNRTPGPIEPIPEFIEYEPFNYSSVNLRSPFDSPDEAMASVTEIEAVPAPDETRVKEFLEGFALSTLVMVGTMSRDDANWVLIKDPNDTVHKITVGDYLGRNHGRVTSTTRTSIELVEIIPTGDGRWTERVQTIEME